MVKENLLQVNVPKYQSMSLGSRLINFAMKTIETYQIIRSIHLDLILVSTSVVFAKRLANG